ncbi:hypothetical protein PNEG_01593 [Pneumocystis murina B123]|uniref:DUF4211 domain-containing protein n=1 Tax=Pneumocystis murina (strain B123) TaxID=1069680 RepID=M7NNS4_PNEMU|nr:hypothetical protein PNEG_01593 [Pneumocystis murina B123]EMR10338.1 hypothetical protein PNEG_01593 [Pneumocystis murina B123]
MNHINAFSLIKDKQSSKSCKRRKKSSKHLSRKKHDKNQSILSFYKEKETVIIISSDEGDLKNKENSSNSFSNSLLNQPVLSNNCLKFKNQNLFKIYEYDAENIINLIEEKEYDEEIELMNNSEKEYCQNISNILHKSEFYKSYPKDYENTLDFYDKYKENTLKNEFNSVSDNKNIKDYSINISYSHWGNKTMDKNTKKNIKRDFELDTLESSENEPETSFIIPKMKQRKIIFSDNSEDSQLEIEEELNNLNKKDILEQRTRGSKRNVGKKVFQQQLEKLKQKKNKNIKKNSEDDSDNLEIIHYPGISSKYNSSPMFSDSETSLNTEESISLDDFIISDNEPIGTPYSQIPVEFTVFSYQGISSHFRIFLYHKIHKLLNPDFIDESKHFIFSQKYLERRFNSLRDSVLSSSAWKQPFINSISSLPIIKSGTCESRFRCDACHISGRTSSFWIRFCNLKYDPKTLEIYKIKELEESLEYRTDDSDKIWYLGRFCFSRAKIAHSFWHWHFNLNEDLKRILKKSGKLDFFKKTLLTMNISERTKKIDEVIRELDNSGKTNEIWENFNNILKKGENFITKPNKFKKDH